MHLNPAQTAELPLCSLLSALQHVGLTLCQGSGPALFTIWWLFPDPVRARGWSRRLVYSLSVLLCVTPAALGASVKTQNTACRQGCEAHFHWTTAEATESSEHPPPPCQTCLPSENDTACLLSLLIINQVFIKAQ